MAVGDNRYNLKLEFTAYDTKNVKDAINLGYVEWNDAPYEALTEFQQLVINLLQGTNDWGKAVVQAKGLNPPPGGK